MATHTATLAQVQTAGQRLTDVARTLTDAKSQYADRLVGVKSVTVEVTPNIDVTIKL
jgi:hypothetical protein